MPFKSYNHWQFTRFSAQFPKNISSQSCQPTILTMFILVCKSSKSDTVNFLTFQCHLAITSNVSVVLSSFLHVIQLWEYHPSTWCSSYCLTNMYLSLVVPKFDVSIILSKWLIVSEIEVEDDIAVLSCFPQTHIDIEYSNPSLYSYIVNLILLITNHKQLNNIINVQIIEELGAKSILDILKK